MVMRDSGAYSHCNPKIGKELGDEPVQKDFAGTLRYLELVAAEIEVSVRLW